MIRDTKDTWHVGALHAVVNRLLGVFNRIKLGQERFKNLAARGKYSFSIGFIITKKFKFTKRVERSNYKIVVAWEGCYSEHAPDGLALQVLKTLYIFMCNCIFILGLGFGSL